ncbi:MAG: DoxX family protein, partial [Gramella sp.]|nr:DoxX family protein [Christiangramia sp.]
THGFHKLLKFFGEEELSFADPIGLGEPITLTLAVFAEFFCSLFIIFGYLTRYAALAIITTMVVAVIIVHWEDPFSKMELPLLFMFGFILIAFTGPGKFSLDFYLKQKFK